MLEIPECKVLSGQLGDRVAGQRVTRAQAAASPHRFAFFQGDPADYPAMLEGRELRDPRCFGGFLEMAAGEDALLTFMDGVNLRYLSPEEKRPAKHQLLLELEDGGALMATVQMYGALLAGPPGSQDDNKYYRAAREAPSPLEDAFDRAHFERLLAEHPLDKLSAKAFLATQQRIPGLGNGCLQDVLFHARVHPKRRMSTLDEGELEGLFRAVKEVLAAMAELGGRDTEKDLYGKPGGYHTRMSKHTLPYPCPECGGSVKKMAYLGGSVYLCEHCQPL